MSTRPRKTKAIAQSIRNPPVSIKKEPAAAAGGLDTSKDSLAYLIEDRVELVKQIFAVLDAKTIKSMAPDHLGGHTAESLQEYCLDELLGISNKRLLSIIDETKCPTDTEDSDSDVEKIDEHISLEEISSESPDDAPSAASRGRSSRRTKHSKDGRSGESTVRTRGSGTGAPNKPMTMLELLELQYRAAAIRSQLAQEPVTKIELESDTEDKSGSAASSVANRQSGANIATTAHPTATSTATNGRTAVVATSPAPPTATVEAAIVSTVPKETSPPKPRPVRLKRNFRQRQDENYEATSGGEEKTADPVAVHAIIESNKEAPATKAPIDPSNIAIEQSPAEQIITSVETTVPASVNPDTAESASNSIEPIEQQRAVRSPTPDVVPIVASPPTFCISSESEGEQETRKQRAGNYINMPAGVSINRPETEDEKFLRHVKETAGTTSTKRTTGSATIVPNVCVAEPTVSKSKDIFVTAQAVSKPDSVPGSQPPLLPEAEPVVQSDPEEGELSDDDEVIVSEATAIAVVPQTTIGSADASVKITDGEKNELQEQHVIVDPAAPVVDGAASSSASSSDSSDSSSSSDSSDENNDVGGNQQIKIEPVALTYTTPDVIALDDDDEDIIDLGKDNLDDFDVDAPSAIAAAAAPVVDAGGKDYDQSKDAVDSWDNRWARSKKVSKVIATARLGSKLRTKIKQNREREANEATASKAAAEARAAAETASQAAKLVEAAKVTSSLEEGSVEQYTTIATSVKASTTN